MIFNLGPIGDWLGERLTANAEELTDDQMQSMKKDDLIKAVNYPPPKGGELLVLPSTPSLA